MMFLAAFLIGVVVDSIPVFAPPAWSILAILVVKYKADPWGVLVFGVLGSTLGRFILSLYITKVSRKLLSGTENKNLAYVGKKFEQGFWKTNLFVLAYTLTPLSTTSLFTAAGMGRVKVLSILPAFALGKFISDAAMLFAAKNAAKDVSDLLHGAASLKTVVAAVVSFMLMGGVLFVDWRTLIEKRKFKLSFRIWKK